MRHDETQDEELDEDKTSTTLMQVIRGDPSHEDYNSKWNAFVQQYGAKIETWLRARGVRTELASVSPNNSKIQPAATFEHPSHA